MWDASNDIVSKIYFLKIVDKIPYDHRIINVKLISRETMDLDPDQHFCEI